MIPIYIVMFSINLQIIVGNQLEFSIKENVKIGTMVGNIFVDQFKTNNNNNNSKLELIKNDYGGEMYFTLLKDTGELLVKSQIDREVVCDDSKDDDCVITLLVDRDQDVQQVRIKIEDVNDNTPVFLSLQKTINIQENIPMGTSYFLPVAQDKDTMKFGVNNYSMTNFRTIDNKNREKYTSTERFFRIEGSQSPQLKVIGKIDREEIPSFVFVLVASDSGMRSGSCTVTIVVTDVNDNSPEWKKDNYKVKIKECQLQGEILELDASDSDDPNTNNGRVSYRFSDRTKDKDKVSQIFYINGNKLYLSNNRPSELSNTGFMKLFINAADGNGRMKEASVDVTVEDCNDHPPIISISNRYGNIRENVREKISLTVVTVKDNDRGRNGLFECTLNDSSVLNLVKKHVSASQNMIIFKIETNGDYAFDRENVAVYTVEIKCTDQGQLAMSSSQRFSVNIIDENDNGPRFDDRTFVFHIAENNGIGSSVGLVKAVDLDSGVNGHLKYNIVGENDHFTVSNYGEIQSKVKFDREDRVNYEFVVIASDGGVPSLNDTTTVKVLITDVNDCTPQFVDEYVFRVFESYGDSIKNERIGEVKAVDRDFGNNGTVSYKLVNIKVGGSIGSTLLSQQLQRLIRVSFDGGVSIYGNLDRELVSSIQLLIEAHDNGSPRLSTQATVVIEILDINDNSPTFLFPNKLKKYLNISIESLIGSQVGSVSSVDPDQGVNGSVSHSILNADKDQSFPLKIESDGKIIVISDLQKYSKNRRLPDRCLVKASDMGVPPKSSIATVFLNYYDPESETANQNANKKSSESPNFNSLWKQKNKNKIGNDNSNLNISDSMMLLYCLAAILFFVFIIVFSVLLYIYCTRAYSASERYSKKFYKSNNSNLNSNQNIKELHQMRANSVDIRDCHSGKNEDGAAVCFLNDDGSSYTHLMMLNNNKYTTMLQPPKSPSSFLRHGDSIQPEIVSISQTYLNSTINNSQFQADTPLLSSKSSLKKITFPPKNSTHLVNCSQNYSTLQDKLVFNSISRHSLSSPRNLSSVDKQSIGENLHDCHQQKDFNSQYVTSSFV